MYRIAVLVALLALCLTPMGVAQAQFGAPNAPDPLTTPPPPPPAEAEKFDDGGLSTLQQVLIFGSAMAVLGLIAFVIVRDARRSAPGDDRARPGDVAGSAKPSAGARGGAAAVNSSMSDIRARERQQAKRAKSKARSVKQQRKRNRPH